MNAEPKEPPINAEPNVTPTGGVVPARSGVAAGETAPNEPVAPLPSAETVGDTAFESWYAADEHEQSFESFKQNMRNAYWAGYIEGRDAERVSPQAVPKAEAFEAAKRLLHEASLTIHQGDDLADLPQAGDRHADPGAANFRADIELVARTILAAPQAVDAPVAPFLWWIDSKQHWHADGAIERPPHVPPNAMALYATAAPKG